MGAWQGQVGAGGKGAASGRGQTDAYPEPMSRLLEELVKLPGIGRRSAERVAFHLLKASGEDANRLAGAVRDVKAHVGHCPVCFNLTVSGVGRGGSEEDGGGRSGLCAVCSDARRDRSRVLVVEQPRDLISIEQAGTYRGLYHVLMGRLSPLDGVGPADLTAAELVGRVKSRRGTDGEIREVILGLSPDLEGDGTGLYLQQALEGMEAQVTKLARGLSSGSSLEFAGKAALMDAIEGRVQA
ncbi:MAG: recombination mediator RecR [Planctomycetota bacterium]